MDRAFLLIGALTAARLDGWLVRAAGVEAGLRLRAVPLH